MLLQCEGITKVFKKGNVEVSALNGVDLKVDRGETVAVVGSSGAGKSTLLHILGTLDRPSAGQLIFGETDLLKLSSDKLASFRNSYMGFVFQFHYLLQEFTALENVLMPAMIHLNSGRLKDAQEKRAMELLDRVGLSKRMSHRPGELSGGEQQRVALARALMNQPELILADELTGNLDSENSSNIRKLLLELNSDLKVTVLVVTHDDALSSSLGRRVILKDGRVSH
jgi:lipoprotein-releasing system ATP-binding protein